MTVAAPALASLPMYDMASVRSSTNRFWLLIRSALCADVEHRSRAICNIREQLIREPDIPAHWLQPSLLLSQTCGYPYIKNLRNRVALVGTPDYGMVEGLPGRYVSQIIVQADDQRTELEQFKGARFAYNSLDSQSGLHAMMHTLLNTVGNGALFGSCTQTFEHIASMKAVAQGQADIAAIDAVTWRLLKQHDPLASRVRVLMTTEPSPGLPYITSLQNDSAGIAAAVESAIEQLSDADQSALGLCGFWRSQPEDYDVIAERAYLANGVCKAHGLFDSC